MLLKKPALAIFASGLMLLGTVQTTYASGSNYNGAQSCEAANLNQAFDLGWGHMRLVNNSTVQRWVTCAMDNEIRTDSTADDGLIFTGTTDSRVSVWFGPESASGAEVFCIFREISSADAGPGVPPASSTAVTITNTEATPVNETATLANGIGDFGNYGTMTCRLDPGTGINAVANTYAPLPL